MKVLKQRKNTYMHQRIVLISKTRLMTLFRKEVGLYPRILGITQIDMREINVIT